MKPAAGGGGFAGMLDMFKGMSPEVQNKAEGMGLCFCIVVGVVVHHFSLIAAANRALDDGSTMELSTCTGRRRALLIGTHCCICITESLTQALKK